MIHDRDCGITVFTAMSRIVLEIYPASYSMCSVVWVFFIYLKVKSSQNVNLTIPFHLVSRLKMSGPLHPSQVCSIILIYFYLTDVRNANREHM
jgi:hypothetical protein